jgi:hypothetical protein
MRYAQPKLRRLERLRRRQTFVKSALRKYKQELVTLDNLEEVLIEEVAEEDRIRKEQVMRELEEAGGAVAEAGS